MMINEVLLTFGINVMYLSYLLFWVSPSARDRYLLTDVGADV